MITINRKYTVTCDNCASEQMRISKADIFKKYVIYKDITNGDIAHFCDDNCAKEYIKDKKCALRFRRITKLKDFNIGMNSVSSNHIR